MLANICGFTTIFAAPKLTGLQHLGLIAEKVNTMAHSKMGSLKRTVWQLWAAKVWRC